MVAILYINNTYISTWEEFKKLVAQTLSSEYDKPKFIQDEIMASARDGVLFDWCIKQGISCSNELNPNKFLGMTDGNLRKLLLDICGAESINIYSPNFNNHIEIIKEYKVFDNDLQNDYSITSPIPIVKAINRRFQVCLKIINPINDIIKVKLIRHQKSNKAIGWIKSIFADEQTIIDLKTKGRLFYLTIDITDIRSNESISLYAEGNCIYTFNTLPKYIDLGLGVKWATCNLGAQYPEDPGDYFAWGESNSRECFIDDNRYCRLSNISGVVPFDAATVKRGTHWRIPKKKEWNALYSRCDVTNIEIGGVPCIKFTSRINKKYIIMPVTGYKDGTTVISRGSHDCYWSSIQDDYNDAYDNKGYFKHKFLGLMIRPIFDDASI